ncbi:hypothetical protein [Pseudomonas sp. N040]|uniref:hypothetical protein n=1 Tax=Pseudomonas sp. N040 TaxID=2785325 RepID=UPI0018A2B823|nr:hypothetical protein [Pseudomonas sp. N040]MBF7731165.1 hypothetical protein [Pseudomonas sp. N040]MBW7014808.1 hypothetical protein [Pseudomonas sp. N040]
MLSPLLPALSPDQLYPASSVYMARTQLQEVRMLGYTNLQLDTATSMLMGLLNGYASVRHEGCAGTEVIELFAAAGITVDEQMQIYSNAAEARRCAEQLVARGHKLFWPYPLPAGFYPESAHLVSPDLYRFLNAKQNLGKLVPQEHLAHQQCLSHAALASFTSPGPVCLKAGGDAATGWGFAVFPCPDQAALEAARSWFAERRESIPCVLVEQWINVAGSWCVGLAISEAETRCFGGAEQVFSSACKQSGSIVDSSQPIPAKVHALAVRIGERVRTLGFRGIAGLDIGIDRQGRPMLFDPNFRIASSTAQLLFHPAAALRSGLPISHSLQITPGGSFADVARKLRGPIESGWFIPTRLFNGEKHPLSNGTHIVTGFVMAADRASAATNTARIRALF